MTGWGLVGVGGGALAWLLRGREPPRLLLALVCALAGLAYGALLDLYQWTLAAQQDVASYLAVSASSLPYNLAHAMGNFVFALLIGPAFVRALRRYRRRFEVRWVRPAPAALLAAALLAGSLAAAAPGARVVLFGSHARGEAGPHSDVDLLVIEPNVADQFGEIVRLQRVLAPLRLPADIVVVSEEHASEWRDVPSTMLYDALREGRVLAQA
jgi:predicted nucleotidyltransferase